MKKVYILVGPPGAGKGTQADLLEKKLGARLIQPGVYLRQQIADKTKIGKQVQPIIAKGNLVPDEIVNEMVFDSISRTKKDVILDGFPRGLGQAEDFHDYLHRKSYEMFVVEIKLKEESVLERISGRRSCTCGETYHLKFNPPEKYGVCDECGEKLYLREDSKRPVVRQRLKVYHQQTRPVLNYFKKLSHHKYISINGEKKIEAIHKEIIEKIR